MAYILAFSLVGVFFVTTIFVSTLDYSNSDSLLNNNPESTSITAFLLVPSFFSADIKKFWYTLAPLIIIALLCLLFPQISFIISVIAAVLFLLQPLSNYTGSTALKNVQRQLIITFHETGFTSFLYNFYNIIFKQTLMTFKLIIISLNGMIVIHAITSRNYFLTQHLTPLTAVLLFLGLIALYIRLIINMYIFINITVNHDSYLKTLFEGNTPEPSAIQPKPLVDFSKTVTNHNTHNHYNEVPSNKWSFSRRAGIMASIITCGAACTAAYYAKEQALYAKEQSYELKRQNDLECLDQKIFTKEDYCLKHPDDCTSVQVKEMSTTLEKFERMEASKKAGMPGIKSTTK
jgi:signal transduction histidine kinase